MEHHEDVSYDVEQLAQSEGDFRKLQYSNTKYQEIMKKILVKFDEVGLLDWTLML